MNILFLHPNFPAQFYRLAVHFAQHCEGRHRVMFLTRNAGKNRIRNIEVAVYQVSESPKDVHPYACAMNDAVLTGEAVARALILLREKAHFVPDVIIGHTGWGSTLFVKEVYPKVPLIGYFEWYYHAFGSDVGYWPEDKVSFETQCRLRAINAHHLVNLETCDASVTPTFWQRQQFPLKYRLSMRVIHEGIDTSFFRPAIEKPAMVLPRNGLNLTGAEEVVTYLSRGFEPYRGFLQFMEAVRILLRRRPGCHVVLAGNDKAMYGPDPAPKKTWRALEEAKGGYDKKRVHFVGHLDYESYLHFLQASTVHVYLTRPFVLSWSVLEALSAGCCVVGSATPPVEEVMQDGENGLLASYRHPESIAARIEEALDDASLRNRLGGAGRETILNTYDLADCLRRQTSLIYQVMK